MTFRLPASRLSLRVPASRDGARPIPQLRLRAGTTFFRRTFVAVTTAAAVTLAHPAEARPLPADGSGRLTLMALPPEVGVPDRPTPLEAVRWCESRDSYTAENPVSSASGAFQAITSTWEWVMDLPAPASAYPKAVQDEFFLRLWDGGRGWRHWAPSASCWEPLLDGEM